MTETALHEVPARKGRAAELRKGQHIKMINNLLQSHLRN